MRLTKIVAPKVGGPFEKMRDKLAKRFPAIQDDVNDQFAKLQSDGGCPVPCGAGVAQVPGKFSRVVVKIRIRSRDMGKGKSGGFRALLAGIGADEWRPFAIYAKADASDLPAKEIVQLLGTGEQPVEGPPKAR